MIAGSPLAGLPPISRISPSWSVTGRNAAQRSRDTFKISIERSRKCALLDYGGLSPTDSPVRILRENVDPTQRECNLGQPLKGSHSASGNSLESVVQVGGMQQYRGFDDPPRPSVTRSRDMPCVLRFALESCGSMPARNRFRENTPPAPDPGECTQTVRAKTISCIPNSSWVGRLVSERCGTDQPRSPCDSRWPVGRVAGNSRARPVALGLLAAWILSAAVIAGEAATYEYDLSIDGESAGVVVTETSMLQTAEGGVRKVDHKISIGTGPFRMIGFSFESVSSSEFGASGLRRFEHRMTIEGERVHVSASLEPDGLVVVASAEGESYSKRFRHVDYDLTSEETLASRLTEMGLERTVKVLDIDEQEINQRTFVWVRNETLRIGSLSIPCKVVRFRDRGSKGTQWIGPDSHPLILQEEGQDEDGRYRLMLKSVR